jgi:hypothetical protein
MFKEAKSQVLKDVKDEEEAVLTPDYTEEERKYLNELQSRLEKTAETRNQNHKEFDNLDYLSYYNANEAGANTEIEPTKNKGERQFQSGTLRTKLFAFLSSYVRLHLMPSITAFNQHEVLVNGLGNALETIIEKTEHLEPEKPKEKRLLRQYELLKQGTVFVEDIWQDRWEKVKEMVKEFTGKRKGTKWNTKVKKALGGPRRRILSFLAVYLGNLREYFIENQPFVFTAEVIDRKEAEQIFGGKDEKGEDIWEMWKYVAKSKGEFKGDSKSAIAYNHWRLTDEIGKNEVEKIVYQSKPDNEIQILLNGIPMLPIGYPLTEISPDGEYTIVQQNLEPIRHDFALGKSFIFRHKNLMAVLDEMMRLAVMKSKKSFLPPRLNLSNRVVSKDMFMPGNITKWSGGANDFPPIDEKETEGVTASEFNMIAETKRFIDENTVSPTTTGSKEQGSNVTATQIVEVQKQARVMMGLSELAASLLEQKLASKRLNIIVAKWFDPIDKAVSTAQKGLKDRFRVVSMIKSISGIGRGLQMVISSENKYQAEQIRVYEDKIEKKLGMPVRITLLNPEELRSGKYTFKIEVHPKEEKTSDYSKIMFDEMVARAMNIGQMIGLMPNPAYISTRFAEVWDEDPGKLWVPAKQEQLNQMPEEETNKNVKRPQVQPQAREQESSVSI